MPKPEPPPAQKKVGVEPVAVFKQEEAGLSGMVSKGGKKEADGQQDAAADAVQASSGASGSLAAKGSDSGVSASFCDLGSSG